MLQKRGGVNCSKAPSLLLGWSFSPWNESLARLSWAPLRNSGAPPPSITICSTFRCPHWLRRLCPASFLPVPFKRAAAPPPAKRSPRLRLGRFPSRLHAFLLAESAVPHDSWRATRCDVAHHPGSSAYLFSTRLLRGKTISRWRRHG